jgi:hypothetical protein
MYLYDKVRSTRTPPSDRHPDYPACSEVSSAIA